MAAQVAQVFDPPPAPVRAPGGREGGSVVPLLTLPTAGAPAAQRARKRQHSRRALVHALREGDLASSRSVEICSSRSVEMLQPLKKEARRAYVPPEDGDDDDGGGVSARSGPPTQRSSRGPPTARMAALLEQRAAAAGALEAKCAGGMAGGGGIAERITSMVLHDAKEAE